MPTIKSNGSDVWYDVQGRGEPLVLTGGYGLMHNQFDFITPVLARDFTVVNWNHRGAGLSDRSWARPFTLDDWVDDLFAILDHLKLRRVTMLGLSYGSCFGIRAATREPNRVRALITSPSFGSTSGPRLARMQDVILGLVETIGFDAFAALVQLMDAADENQMGGKALEQMRWIAKVLPQNLTLAALGK